MVDWRRGSVTASAASAPARMALLLRGSHQARDCAGLRVAGFINPLTLSPRLPDACFGCSNGEGWVESEGAARRLFRLDWRWCWLDRRRSKVEASGEGLCEATEAQALSIRLRGCLAPDAYDLASLMAFGGVWRMTVRCVIGLRPQQKSQEIF
ncbi:unnamed protein product [Caenorhabditis auriculariae]|uniref:Uncharacterized protein n=1 Tax=Caenorhabditis auriculariae TaxID=2777116 RepID=A0A8S1GVJ4_9PELO|nr:unnamed protein product [Caenorhabditis auriculariae]